jgi:hypothetical protein
VDHGLRGDPTRPDPVRPICTARSDGRSRPISLSTGDDAIVIRILGKLAPAASVRKFPCPPTPCSAYRYRQSAADVCRSFDGRPSSRSPPRRRHALEPIPYGRCKNRKPFLDQVRLLYSRTAKCGTRKLLSSKV